MREKDKVAKAPKNHMGDSQGSGEETQTEDVCERVMWERKASET